MNLAQRHRATEEKRKVGVINRIFCLLRASVPLCENCPPFRAAACVLTLLLFSGCTGFFHRGGSFLAPGPVQNPLFIPAVDREFLWNQTVDAVDDYFRIEREDRVRLIGGVLTEGWID